ncbi:MAG: hypothetical protein WC728_11565 [Elusimicrobiota bacterium]
MNISGRWHRVAPLSCLLAVSLPLCSAAPQDTALDDANRALDAAKAVSAAVAPTLVPLRPLPKDKRYAVRVLYLEDERLPTFSGFERAALYGKVQTLLKDWYGYSVDIQETRRESLSAYFKALGPVFASPKNAGMIRDAELDPSTPEGLDRLDGVIWHDLKRRKMSLIRRYFPLPQGASKDKATTTATALFLERLNAVRSIPTKDGTPFYTRELKDTQSFPHWLVVLRELQEADFILTNTAMAGADSSMPIYVIARGGITTGMVDNNPSNPYQAVGVVAFFPLLSEAPFFLKNRGEIPKEERIDAVATFWMHELGHFFPRYGEAYGEEGCVHVAPEGLAYYAWVKGVQAKQGRCSLKPGIVTRF